MLVNCKKCFFSRIFKDGFGLVIRCYSSLTDNPKKMTKYPEQCETFGNLTKANELWNNKEKYSWKDFGKDKRTAHYRTTKKIQLNGADKYLTIYTWTEYKYFDGDPIYSFWHEKALVHYKDGSFKVHKFRSIQNGKCGW